MHPILSALAFGRILSVCGGVTAHQRKITASVSKLLGWFSKSARDLPWRRTRDPYAIWVSEIMLQQTQVKTVIPYWERWMRAMPTVESLAAAKPEVIHKLWEGLGYYTRVRNMQKAAQVIMANHQGQFPRSHKEIFELPGIGRYTAGAISSIAFNEPRPILDGNVIRVLTRLFGVAENPREKLTNEKLWRLAGELVLAAAQTELCGAYPSSCSHLNQALMELGALICTPKQPKCLLCPVREQCVAYRTGRVEQLPNLGARTVATSRHFIAFVIEDRGRFLVRQRPAGVVNGHLWEFPNVEVASGESQISNLKSQRRENPHPRLGGYENSAMLTDAVKAFAQDGLSLIIPSLEKLCVIKHSITRYRITLEAFRAGVKRRTGKAMEPVLPGNHVDELGGNRKKAMLESRYLVSYPDGLLAGGCWATLEELELLAFTSAHRKVLKCLVVRQGRRI